MLFFFFFQAEDGIRDRLVTGVQTCALPISDGRFNMKNPACYVFPSENNCIPGDHFRADQKEELLSFISYKGYLFSKPKTQHISNWLSLITFLMCGGFLLLCCLQGVRVSYRQQS